MDVPPILEETVEMVRLVPRERVQQRTAEQIVDVPQFGRQILGETVEMVRNACSNGSTSELWSRPFPQLSEESVEEFEIVPSEQFSE